MRFPPALLLAVGLLCVLVAGIAFPWAQTVASAGFGALVSVTTSDVGRQAIVNSLAIGVLSVLGAAVVGSMLALALRYVRIPLPRLARVMAALPLAFPPLVGTAAFYFLLSESGIVPRSLHALTGIPTSALRIEGFWAVVLIHAHAFYVYFYFFVSDALETVDRSEVEAARLMGAQWIVVARRIVWPHLAPSFVRAALLVFIASLASFSAPLLFGGGMRFLTLEMFNAKMNGSNADAAAYATILSAASIVVLAIARSRRAPSKGTSVPFVRRPGRIDPFLAAVTWAALGAIALPAFVLVLLAFSQEGSWTTQLVPPRYTFENLTRMFTDGSVVRPLLTSLGLAGITVAVTTTLAAAVAWCTGRSQLSAAIRRPLELLATAPAAIPGTVIGISILLAFSTPHWFTFGSVFTGTSAALLIAYATRTIPFATQSLAAAYSGIPASLEEAASSLGAGSWRTARTVLLPLVMPSLLSAAVFTFVTAFGEFPATTLLFVPLARPASIEIFQRLRVFDLGAAASLGVVMIVIAAAATSIGRERRPLAGG